MVRRPLGFWVQGLGSWSLGFRVLEFRVQDFGGDVGFRGWGFRILHSHLGFRLYLEVHG